MARRLSDVPVRTHPGDHLIRPPALQGRAFIVFLALEMIFLSVGVSRVQAATPPFVADQDAKVLQQKPDNNYGTTNSLVVSARSGRAQESFLRFTVSGLTDPVQSVKLRLYASIGVTPGPSVWGVADSWSESTITWTNSRIFTRTPQAIATLAAVPNGTWAEWDVTSYLTATSPEGNGVWSFVVVGNSSSGATFNSREGTNKPQLVITPRDVHAPSAPRLSATAVSTTQIDLSWTASIDDVGVVGYDVYRDDSKITSLGPDVTTYSDTGLTPTTLYGYQVKAKDAAGNIGASNTAQATTLTPDTTAPDPAPILTAPTVAYNHVDLSWTASNDTGGLAGYDVYRDNGTSPYATVGPSVLTYSDTTVAPSTAYSYYIKARDTSGNTTASNTVNVTTPAAPDATPPGAPTNLNANASSPTQVDLTWVPSSDNVAVTGYDIYRGIGSSTPTLLKSVGPGNSASDATVSPSTTYTYYLIARDAAGNSSDPSNTATAITPTADTTPPSPAPVLSTTAVAFNHVDLSWTASNDTGGLAGYDVYRGNGTSPYASVGPSVLTYSDATVAPSTAYSYYVKARDTSGNTTASNTVNVTTPAASSTVTVNPEADAKVQEANPSSNFATTTLQVDAGTAVRVNAYLRFTLSGLSGAIQTAKLRLLATTDGTSFGPSVSAAASNSWGETSINWSNQPGTTGPTYGGGIAMPPSTWAEWDVKPLISGNGTYSFVLTTTNTDGIYFSSREDGTPANRPQLVVTSGSGGGGDTEAPTQPGTLTASAVSSSQINLAWGASNDNVGVTGYDIYRGGTYLKSVTTTSASDTGLSASTTYSYYVIAFDAAANRSAPSNTATATTQAGGGGGDPTIAAAGDIACDPLSSSFNNGNGTTNSCRQKYTSDLLVNGGYFAVLDLGDNQYYCGAYNEFTQSYDPSWGRVKSITHPSVGNHEYLTSGATGCDSTNAGAAGYFRYFGSAAGQSGQGWYSFNVGSWHLIALNSNCGDAGGCSSGSAQYTWLQNDLNANTNKCVLAYWHIPLYSSGGRAASNTQSFWNLLYNANADVILSGHDHIYERFAPQNTSAGADTSRGIRELIVGTGGANHTSIASVAANSEVRDTTTYGVLKMTLHSTSYDWQFVRDAGSGSFTDSGSSACH